MAEAVILASIILALVVWIIVLLIRGYKKCKHFAELQATSGNSHAGCRERFQNLHGSSTPRSD